MFGEQYRFLEIPEIFNAFLTFANWGGFMNNQSEVRKLTFLEEEKLAYKGENFHCDIVVCYYHFDRKFDLVFTPEEKTDFTNHLATCLSCQEELKRMQSNDDEVTTTLGITLKLTNKNQPKF